MASRKLLGVDNVNCPRCQGRQWIIILSKHSGIATCNICGGDGTVDEVIAQDYRADRSEKQTRH